MDYHRLLLRLPDFLEKDLLGEYYPLLQEAIPDYLLDPVYYH
jgi:hypothetical protein